MRDLQNNKISGNQNASGIATVKKQQPDSVESGILERIAGSQFPSIHLCGCCQCENLANTNATCCKSNLREYVQYVGFVEGRKSEAFLAEIL